MGFIKVYIQALSMGQQIYQFGATHIPNNQARWTWGWTKTLHKSGEEKKGNNTPVYDEQKYRTHFFDWPASERSKNSIATRPSTELRA